MNTPLAALRLGTVMVKQFFGGFPNNSQYFHFCLYYRSESAGQVFLFLLAWLFITVEKIQVESWSSLFLAYDNMCQVNRMRVAQAELPLPPPFNKMWLMINKIIDELHIRNHVSQCQELMHPKQFGEMYPDLKETKNTMAAEQTFVWLGRFKKIVCSMPKVHHLFYIHRVVRRRNDYNERYYRLGKKPVLPGIRMA